MRALVCIPGGVEMTSVPDPQPAPGDVVVRVEACGICGSDVHAVERGLAADGHILGHEFSGVIAALGAGVGGWREGQPVAVNPLGSCADCAFCRQGLPFLCRARPNLGLGAPGAYAEYVAVPAAQLAALPADVEPEIGAHAEPLAVALRAVELGEVSQGDAALVYGVGPVGLNVIMALRLAGAGHIIAVGRSAGRRAAAAALGAHVVLDARVTDVAAFLAEAGAGCGSAYECSGAPHALGETLAALAPGGISVQVALPAQASPLRVRDLVAGGLRVVGSCAFSPDNYARAVDCLVTGQVAGSALISERVPLDEAPDALTRLRDPGDLVRVLIRPWQADSGLARRPG
jgi:threonine dehydrogenase-like Zn-dependent dehydrogenase